MPLTPAANQARYRRIREGHQRCVRCSAPPVVVTYTWRGQVMDERTLSLCWPDLLNQRAVQKLLVDHKKHA